MIVKDTEFIKQDMESVCQGRNSNDFEYYNLSQYFDRTKDNLTPLANSAGELYLRELADFMSYTLLPSDGSWVQIMYDERPSQEEYFDTESMLDVMRRKLADSNFYGKMQELMVHGLIYNRGFITVEYTKGLTFDILNDEDTWVTEERDEYSNRTYARSRVSLSSLFATYTKESIPEHIQKKWENYEKTGMEETVTVVTALLPNRPPYVMVNSSKYKFIEVNFLEESCLYELEKQNEKSAGFSHFPLCRFRTGNRYSLAQRALPDAMMVNKYEQMFYDQGELITYPPMGMSAETVARGSYDLGPRGQVPLNNHEREPKPIQTTASLNISEATIAKKEQRIREIFKIDLINRVKVTQVSQAEYYQNYYNTLKSIQPLAMNLVYRTITTLAKRIHKLLLDNDKEYKRLATNVNQMTLKNIKFDHIGALLKKAATMSQIGRFGQAAQFYLQVDPDAAVQIDVDKALQEAANTLGIPQILRPKEEAQAQLKARAEAVQQQQAVEQQTALNQGGQDGGGNQTPGAPAGAPTGGAQPGAR